MSSLTGFFIAVSIVALICFGLMIRTDRVRDRRRAYADSTGGDTSVISSGNDGLACSTGSAAAPRRPHPTIPAHRPPRRYSAVETPVAATGEAAEMVAAVVATNRAGTAEIALFFPAF